ncbi:MAG: hypothetical protein LC664_10895, partial [Flavobacteriales bacterium]|nr:hypothetical protein [Flavobacteriales bacterium]
MKTSKAGSRVIFLFYLLTFYILLQFFWWAYLLIDLNNELFADEALSFRRNKILMVVGEGTVFLTFLLLGIFIMQRTIRKELKLVRQQRNFLLSITHELKTPISAIKLCLETLTKRRGLAEESVTTLYNNASENTVRLNELVENVLLATRIENGMEPVEKTRVNISDLVLKTIERLLKGQTRYIDPILNIDPNIIIYADPSSVESIVANLFENALKYGGNKPIAVGLTFLPDERVLLEVKDEGVGIPESAKAVVTQKFYRYGNEETRSKKGTGLG